tara:strand:- start:55 stop:297 length:243 start_codon:yes stop_codon:yes gene_type:complete
MGAVALPQYWGDFAESRDRIEMPIWHAKAAKPGRKENSANQKVSPFVKAEGACLVCPVGRAFDIPLRGRKANVKYYQLRP